MANATVLAAMMLAGGEVSEEHFFGATALLSTRFDRCGDRGDLRSDGEAPQLLFDWFAHAQARVPDIRVWDLNCQIHQYFEPENGLYLPQGWPWDTRDRLLDASEHLRDRTEWLPVLERALLAPNAETISALVCCGAERLGIEPFPMLWRYLSEHVDSGYNWHLIAHSINRRRLPGYLELARMTLLRGAGGPGAAGRGAAAPSMRHEELWDVWCQVLQLLDGYPGEGIDLIEQALRSHDSGLRIRAIELLALHWRGACIPADTWNLIRECAATEADETARRGFELLLHSV